MNCVCPHWEEDDEGDIFLDSNREDVRFDNVPTFLMLVLVTLLNVFAVLAFVFNSISMQDVAIAGFLAAVIHGLYTLICRIVLGSKLFWELTCVTPEVLLSLTKLLGSILVLVLLRIDEDYERSRAMAQLLFWCCFVLSLIMPRFVVHGWLACAQCARRQVSKNRKRYRDGDFDLDLAYISERILAMSFPAQDLEAQFRNPMAEVQRFLRSRHPKHRVYNLCKEEGRRYDDECFREVRRRITFFDHTVCPLQRLVELLEEQHRFLREDTNNVVVIHCKAGKGRTGLVCSCLLLREGVKSDACKALETYAKKRTHDGKGVTIPSQIRYVKLYSQFLQEGFLRKQVVRLKSVCLQNFMKLPGYRSSSFKVQIKDTEKAVLAEGFSGQSASMTDASDSSQEDSDESSASAVQDLHHCGQTKLQENDSLVIEMASDITCPDDFQIVISRQSSSRCGLAEQVEVIGSFWLNSGYLSKGIQLPLEEIDYCRSLQHLSHILPDEACEIFCSFEILSGSLPARPEG